MVALCLQQRRETPYIFMVGSGKPLTEIKWHSAPKYISPVFCHGQNNFYLDLQYKALPKFTRFYHKALNFSVGKSKH